MILTIAEYNMKKDQLLKAFAGSWKSNMQASVWRISYTGISRDNAKLLWLFVFVLDNYTHSASASNFITEQTVLKIFEKVNSIQ